MIDQTKLMNLYPQWDTNEIDSFCEATYWTSTPLKRYKLNE